LALARAEVWALLQRTVVVLVQLVLVLCGEHWQGRRWALLQRTVVVLLQLVLLLCGEHRLRCCLFAKHVSGGEDEGNALGYWCRSEIV
jgi:hypothetical protein